MRHGGRIGARWRRPSDQGCAVDGDGLAVVPLQTPPGSGENARKAPVVEEIAVYGIGTLSQAVGLLAGKLLLEPCPSSIGEVTTKLNRYDVDFSDVRGQEFAKQAMVIARPLCSSARRGVLEETKGMHLVSNCWLPFCFLGRPGARTVCSNPSVRIVSSAHAALAE